VVGGRRGSQKAGRPENLPTQPTNNHHLQEFTPSSTIYYLDHRPPSSLHYTVTPNPQPPIRQQPSSLKMNISGFSSVGALFLFALSLLLHSKTSAYPIITDVVDGDTKVFVNII
jgi:hypothetical protein